VAFWSGEKLLAQATAPDSKLITPFSKDQIDCNAYTLRMGIQYYKTSDREVKSGDAPKRELLGPNDSFIIPSGQFAFLLSRESISVPIDSMAFISMRLDVKLQGLINVSGFNVDPGYSGKLVYAVYNASPSSIQIAENDPLFKIWFCNLDGTVTDKYTKISDGGLNEITSKMMRGMNRETISIQALKEDVESLRFSMRLQATIFGVASGVGVTILLALAVFVVQHAVAILSPPKDVHAVTSTVNPGGAAKPSTIIPSNPKNP
jgi:dCTP deaminase